MDSGYLAFPPADGINLVMALLLPEIILRVKEIMKNFTDPDAKQYSKTDFLLNTAIPPLTLNTSDLILVWNKNLFYVSEK